MPGGILGTVEKGIFPGEMRWLSVSPVAVVVVRPMISVAETEPRAYLPCAGRVIVGIVSKFESVVLTPDKTEYLNVFIYAREQHLTIEPQSYSS